jgi:uncharacterized protein (DUF427 family)
MSLVTGRGPLSADPAGQFSPPIPADLDIRVYVEPHQRRVQAVHHGDLVIDTESALMVHRQGQTLSYAFPVDAIGGLPAEPVPEAPGFVRVPWDAVDAWFEEGRKLVHYPPNPYHRVDCRPTKRRLTVSAAGTTLVDTVDTLILFETSLAPRLYVNPSHVRTDLLRRSETTSYCNYKGVATYWSTDDTEDIAWSYEETLPESMPIKGLLSFDADRVEVVAELPQAP